MTVNRRIVGLVGLLFALCSVVAGPAVRPAVAEAPGSVQVTLTSITPTVLSASGELVISGTVTNTTDSLLQRLEVRLWRDAAPLRSVAALSSGADQRTGAVMESASARQTINQNGTLAPGASADFTVRAILGPDADEQLWLSMPDAAYRVGVEVYGWPPSGGYQELGQAAALMPYPGSTPTRTATIVVLNHRPTLLRLAAAADQPAIFADDSLAAELSGRLGDLLSLSEAPGVWTIIDPALYDEVVALSAGYQVQAADGAVVAGSPAQARLAAAWLARLMVLADQGRLGRSLYSSVDVLAASNAGRQDVTAAASVLAPDHRLARLPLLITPADYQVDPATVQDLAAIEPWLVLARNLGGPAAWQSAGTLRLLAVNSWLASADQSEVELRGRLLSQQLLGAQQGQVSVSVVDSTAQAQLELAAEPWRVREPLPPLTETEPVGHALASVPSVTPAPELIAATDRASQLLAAWGELVGDAPTEAGALPAVITTGWSTSFGRDTAAQVAWLERSVAPAADLLASDALQLRISDWVTTSADDNLLPVTVTNNATHEVQVRVHFESENPLRISVDDSELFSVQPGESTTVRVRPRTQGNGKVAITAQLTTAGGHPVGQPAAFVVTGTDAGRVGWLIIVASGAVLLVATMLRVRQVRDENRTS